jgi:ComF family protein
MRDNALDLSTGAPPGIPPRGIMDWRAATSVLRSRVFALRSPLFSLADDLVTTLFPSDCRVCGDPLLRTDSVPLSVPVCDLCLSRLLPQSKAYPSALCRCCGDALGMEGDRFAYPVEGVLCALCRQVPPPFERAAAYGVYEGALREMLHLLKYDGVRTLAQPLGAKLAEAVLLLEASPAFTGEVTVVAVPLFAGNQRRRGFNQSILLADEAIACLRTLRPQWKLTARHSLLRRVRETESQFNLSTKGRRRNLVGAFKVQDDAHILVGRDLLLIDDIFTTGATSRACSLALRRAGARRVWVATLAHAQKEQVALWSSGPNSGLNSGPGDFG